jgi:hypothetical protein
MEGAARGGHGLVRINCQSTLSPLPWILGTGMELGDSWIKAHIMILYWEFSLGEKIVGCFC